MTYKNKQVTIYLHPENRKLLEEISKKLGVNMSALINLAISKKLREEKILLNQTNSGGIN